MPRIQLSFVAINTIRAGKELIGQLEITVHSKVRAKCIKASFSGEEFAKIRHKTGSTRVRTYRERQELIKIRLDTREINAIIQQNNNTLPLGFYVVPFFFHIPSALPASMEFGDCNSSTKIEYTLQAELVGSGLIHDYKTRHVVRIRAKPRPLPTIPHEIIAQSHRIQAGVVCNRGQMTLGARADDVLLVPGQQMRLDLAIVNESLASIHKIQVVLREVAEWWVQEEYRDTIHTESSTTRLIDHSWSMKDSLVCKKMDSNLFSKKLVQHSDRIESNFDLVTKQLATSHDLISLTLPPVPESDCHGSYQGDYLKVTHELTVILETKLLCSNPEFRIPIQIACGRKVETPIPTAILIPEADPLDVQAELKQRRPELPTAVVVGVAQ